MSNESHPGSTGHVNAYTLSLIEQKFQHFLNATKRAGSVYGGCAGRGGTWAWDEEGHWIVRRRPQIQFGCSCLAASFLSFWYNYNEDYFYAWHLGTYRIDYALDHSVVPHDVVIPAHRAYTGLRGFREFVEDGTETGYFDGDFYLTRAGTMADFINTGALLFVRRAGQYYHFKWDPDIFNDFNVVAFGGHHAGLYIKRGSGGEHEPPERGNRPHQIWRLAADGSSGTPTTWRPEELRVRICPINTLHPRHFTRASGRPVNTIVRRVHLYDAETTALPQELLNKHVTLPEEMPSVGKPRKHACASVTAFWKLKDLRPHALAPVLETYEVGDDFLNNPPRAIEHQTTTGSGTDVAIPSLNSMVIMKQVEGQWEVVQRDGIVRAGETLRAVIDSTGVVADTAVTIEVYDTNDDRKIPYDGVIEGDCTQVEFELLNFIVPGAPDNKIIFTAWIYERDFYVEAGWYTFIPSA